jgi:hypothetical protein
LVRAVKILSNVGIQLIKCNRIVLNIVALDTLQGNFTRGDGSVQYKTPRNKTRREIRSGQRARRQIVCCKCSRLQLVRCNRPIDDVFIRNRIVGDFNPVNRPIRNLCRRDRPVRDLIHRYGERRNLLGCYRAILDILRIDHTVAAHAETNLDPLCLKTINRQRRHRRNQNVAVAQVHKTVATDVVSVPRLLNVKPRSNIERHVHGGIDRPRADNHRVASTCVGGNRIIVQNAGRDGSEGHIFENGCQQLFQNSASGFVQTQEPQRQKRQKF